MKILEMGLAQSSVAAIKADKHVVIGCTAADSNDLFEFIDCEAPQVIVVDVDTHDWLLNDIKALRGLEVNVPVVALVSPNCVQHRERRTVFLEGGGNDLLEKPIHNRELIASMDSLSRLYSKSLLGNSVTINYGATIIKAEINKGYVTVDDKKLILTTKELQVLVLLMLHKDHVVSKRTIQDTLYGFLETPDNNSVEVFLVRIRQKLHAAKPGAELIINTVRGVGYKIVGD